MRVLLTEGSGLTSRQVATRLGELGHEVEILSSTSLCLARFTRHVRRVHEVPPFGREPLRWLDAAMAIARSRRVDVLLPTQEQVTVLSAFAHCLPVKTLVPAFESLLAVQDKFSAYRTLRRLAVPQPVAHLVSSAEELSAVARFPAFVKRAVSTASSGVRRADSPDDLRRAFAELHDPGAEILVQEAVEGPLAMVQAIADHGRLIAVHANVRVREGAGGGASAKESVVDPRIAAHLAPLVEGLSWHGPLSLDAILAAKGPLFIDVNPRLVEPRNALLAGVDFVELALALAVGEHPAPHGASRPGVRSHQLLLAELGAARSGRRAVLRELVQAAARTGPYAGSVEELTPARADLLALLPVAVVTSLVLARPSAWRRVAGTSVEAYAISALGWEEIQRRRNEGLHPVSDR